MSIPPHSKFSCAVVTPIGPGHEGLYQECQESVSTSYKRAMGLFSHVFMVAVDDTQGLYGRSRARNMGVREALERRADWVFFLDADDLMAPFSFADASPFLLRYDAVWGRIYSFSRGLAPEPRRHQLAEIGSVVDILTHDPFLTLQMGHFVRTRVAFRTPFDPHLDAGEDFDYYLRVWSKHQCVKIPYPLFFNRRGCHSSGPRSATGLEWRSMVRERFVLYAQKWGLLPSEPRVGQAALA